MTPSHSFAAKISIEHQLVAATALQIVHLVLNGLAEAVASGDVIDIPGIGTLRTETVAERLDHHPSNSAAITVPSSARVTFRPATDN